MEGERVVSAEDWSTREGKRKLPDKDEDEERADSQL